MSSPAIYTPGNQEDVTAELERRVVEINKAFAGWIIASWEMCPTHVWRGAAQEYCNKIDKLMNEFAVGSPGGSETHTAYPGNTIMQPQGATYTQPKSSPPPFATTPAAAAVQAGTTHSPNATSPPQTLTFGNSSASFMQPQAKPAGISFNQPCVTGSPSLPGPTPSESPNKGGFQQLQQQHQQSTVAAPVTTAAASRASRKRRATEDPEGAPNAHNPPKPPLFSSIAGSQTSYAAAAAPAPMSFGANNSRQGALTALTAARDIDKSTLQTNSSGGGDGAGALTPIPKPPLFGSLFSTSKADSSAAASGAAVASSAAGSGSAPDPSSKPFAALFGVPSTAPSTTSNTLFGSSLPSFAAGSASSASGGFGGPFGSSGAKADGKVAASFSFGSATAGTPLFGAGAGFGAAASATASISTPSFGTLGPASSAANTAAPAAAPADDDAAEKEPTQKVELKGDDKTDIKFGGKTSFRFMVDGKWTDGTVGVLTIRKDKASGTHWLQVNSETKGSILLYAAFIKTASATVGTAKGTVMLALNVFKYPPGKEPNKTVDDGAGGRKTLSEKEDNPVSVKNSMFKVKPDNLTPLVDTITGLGIKCTKK